MLNTFNFQTIYSKRQPRERPSNRQRLRTSDTAYYQYQIFLLIACWLASQWVIEWKPSWWN